jgi:hypothetical protein
LWISQARYGWTWLFDPIVLIIIALIVFTLLVPLIKRIRRGQARLGGEPTTPATWARHLGDNVFLVFIAGVFIAASLIAMSWDSLRASLVIYSVTGVSVFLIAMQLVLNVRDMGRLRRLGAAAGAIEAEERKAEFGRTVAAFFWIFALAFAVGAFGFHVSVPVFVLAYVRAYRGSWASAIGLALVSEAFLIVIFDLLLRVAWPTPWLVEALT